jgi:hypothetical protein
MTPQDQLAAEDKLDGLIAIGRILEAATVMDSFPSSVYGWLGRTVHRLATEVSELLGDIPA